MHLIALTIASLICLIQLPDPNQRIPNWGSLAAILSIKPVQDSLHLSESQKARLGELLQSLKQAGIADEELRRELRIYRILEPAQLSRLGEIRLQFLGAMALLDPEVQRSLELSEYQRERLSHERLAQERRLDSILMKVRFNSGEDKMLYIISFWRNNKALLSVLEGGQQDRFKRMMGEPSAQIEAHVARQN
jgi:hypothetical protein